MTNPTTNDPGTTLLPEMFSPTSIAMDREKRIQEEESMLAELCKEALILGKNGVRAKGPSRSSDLSFGSDDYEYQASQILEVEKPDLLETDHPFVDLVRSVAFVKDLLTKATWDVTLVPDLQELRAEGPAIILIRGPFSNLGD